ncbi:MAG TPA: LLM class flavin-dependent oxidoreductase [Ilumatobacteraceae bacterium]|nr:LLM class flavin-dependent oxidoreductase [Ilumatobacteraceae bacterium]
MEFGIFIQSFVPQSRRDKDPDAEHTALMNDLEVVQAADKAGFKFAWVTEHHFLDEYSHLSANDVVTGYLAARTERIHIGSGIFNPLPQVNHPAKVAERVAMLDHLSEGRFEFGTGRGAGSHEILGFLPGMKDLSGTREIWEDVIREFPKMWLQDEYEGYDGKYWSLPPRKVLPKPWGAGHPAMWYAAGNTSSYEMAARYGLGVLGFSVGDYESLAPVLKSYKDAIVNAEPIGAFVNNNIMVTSAAVVDEDEHVAREAVKNSEIHYLQSNTFRYHDTFPHPEGIPTWPDIFPRYTDEMVDAQIAGGMVVGNPDQALEICKRWESAGADQLVFGVGMNEHHETLKMIELMGKHVIPKIDTDPEVSTARYRRQASQKG